MNEPTTLGSYLRRERERRGLTLRTISESTKVSVALLEGLEADDLSRWPGGIFRRAFVRSYAQCVGLDADDVFRRFERQHQPAPEVAPVGGLPAALPPSVSPAAIAAGRNEPGVPSQRSRTLGTAADLTVALILAFASAAAGSRLLWPVLLIACYYAVGILLTGTSPMVALLSDQASPAPVPRSPQEAATSSIETRGANERRHQPRRLNERPRQRRGVQARAQ
jgi:hypothetical protein